MSFGDVLVARGLPRLALQAVDLARDLDDHVLEPLQIVFGGLQPHLGLVPPRVQAGDARRFLEDAPALLAAWR